MTVLLMLLDAAWRAVRWFAHAPRAPITRKQAERQWKIMVER